MLSILRRARRTNVIAASFAPLRAALLLPLVLALSLVGSAAQAKDAALVSADAFPLAAFVDLSGDAVSVEPAYDADGNKIEPSSHQSFAQTSPSLVNGGTYVFAATTGAALEDMSAGTRLLLAADTDDAASAIAPIGFDFWYDGVRQTLFSANANGLMRLGVAVISTAFTNSMVSTANNPHIAPYWDDLWLGNNGRVHYKVVGSAPNRKLVVEWTNEQIPRAATALAGAGTFQAWLFESTGVIEFVYGSGIAVNSANGGYTIGLGTSATSFAAVTTTTNTVSYVAANDTQTGAIPSGTAYTFTPNAPNAPGALSFTAVGLNTMTLNWADTNTNEFGYAIYRSVDGVSYEFVRQTAVDAVSSIETGLASNTTWSWRVVAVTEGGVSTASSSTQATTTGTVSGTRTVGPTGVYASLGAAVSDINTNGLAGAVILELQAAYASGVETFPLVINALGSPTSSITIRPETGATALSITSAATQTIDLNPATNVTIDGRAGGAGASQLTIANTVVTGNAVRFLNGASRNTIQFATIAGVNTSTTGGVVLFSTSTGVTGNNRNTIDSCDVRDGAATPVIGIASIGTASTNLLNTGNTISNNNIFNFFSATVATNGILVTTNTNLSNTGWTISSNRIFQTVARNYTSTNTHRGILVIGGNDYSVSGNVVGFAAANGTGTYTMTSTAVATAFTGIQVQPGSGVNSIQGNTVAGISLGTTTGSLAGISVTIGSADIGTITGNTIGSPTGNGSLTATSTTNGAFILGINVSGTAGGNYNVANNTIGSLTATGSPATVNPNQNVVQILGGLVTFTNNLLGSNSTPNSIQTTTAGTPGTAQQLIGMLTGTTMPLTISGNTLANITNAGTGTAHVIRGIQFQQPGISAAASAGKVSILSNNVHDITGSNANTAVGATSGIFVTTGTGGAPAGGLIELNTVNTIRATNAGTVATGAVGIFLSGASTTVGVTGGVVSRNRVYDIQNASTMAVATTPPL
ncbi:MAG: fibronectin type III domain-containing protein, partial [Thermoanaerobaculia bacterium]